MKRFLSIILTAAMLMSATPAVFAENNAVDESVIVAEELNFENQEEITEEVAENVTEDVSEEISGEGEENSEEQISLMSGENDISLMANEADEAQYSTDGSTWTSSSLSDAVTAIGERSGTIKVLRDITISSKIEIAGNITLVANDKDVTITRADTLTGVPVISIASGATLNLGTQTAMENTLTIDGGAIWNGNDGYPNTEAAQSTDKSNNTGVRGNFAIIRTDGTFNMYENVILQNNHNNTSDATNHSGGGVDIENAGVFNMHGGKIWKCSSASQAEWGGGVTVAGLDYELETPATFNLYGGEICYNSAGIGGGVSVGNPNSSHDHRAIFNMYGGNIHHNKVGSMDAYSGAGVYVADKAVFTMKDGSITENTAETKNGYALGGGVESVGTFNMSGGTISGNTAKSGGAGIFLMYNNNVNCEANITGGNIINNNGEGIFINDTKAYLNISGNVNISGNTTTGIYIEKDASPINIAGELTNTEAISVDSNINEDGTVIVTVSEDLNISNYVSKFQHKSKHLIVKDNKLVLGVEPEVEYTYYKPPYIETTEQGTLEDALAAIGGTSNSGKIKLLKDIAVKSTINVKIEELDGSNFTITRADGFTGEIVNHSSGTLKIHDITLDGESKANIQSPLIVAEKGSGLATNLILNKVTLKNNFNAASNSKGGAIYAEGAAIGQTTSNDPVFCENVTVENCSAVYGGAIYNSACDDAMYFLNSEFNGNKADTGSALYIDYGSESRSINLSGCSFTNNDFTDSDSNTTAKTKKTVVYATSSQQLSGQILYVSGDTKFDNASGTVSDIMLDGKLAQSSSSCNFAAHNSSAMTAINNVGSSPIRVAVGTISQYKVISLLEEFSVEDLDKTFILVAANDSTLQDNYKFLRRGEEYGRYATIKTPQYIGVRYNSTSGNISQKRTAESFNTAAKGVVVLTDDLSIEEHNYMERAWAYEDKNCNINVAANNAAIKEAYATYKTTFNTTIDKRIDGIISTDKKSATLAIGKEALNEMASYSIMEFNVYIEYEVLAQPITIASVTGGTISTNPAGSANVGSTVQLNYTANDGYEFAGWNVYKTGEPSIKVSVSGNSFTMPSYGVTVSATFVKKKYAVTITTEGKGNVSISPKSPVEVGQTVKVTATPDEHWELSSLTMNGTDITSAKSFTMPNETVELKATFVKQQFTVTASSTENGTIELISTSPLDWGENFTINVQADPHYEIDTVIVDGKAVSVNEQGDYTFVMPTHNVTVSATFKKVKYTITGTGDHATFSIPSSDTYNWGDTVEFTVTPDKWYSVKSIYADNETVAITKVDGKENAYSFTMPQGNVIITAVTERPNFTVTFDSKGGSNITPKTVANGDVADKPGVPIWAGRGFAGWYTDEACTQKYDFTAPVTESITLYAHWFLWGDVNNDGVTDSKDALLIRRCKVGLISYDSITNNIAGCVNGISETKSYPDSNDALAIRRFCVGLINRYAVEDSAAGYEFDLENDTYIPKN